MITSLVTGGSGFTGRFMVDHLKKQGHRVIALASTPCGADEHHQVDLNDLEALSKLIISVQPQQVYHLAALSFVGHSRPLDFYQVNVLGTENLLTALCALPAPPKVLLASSANVYGANAQAVISEQVAPAPVNHYACSKLAMEHMASTFRTRLPMVICRPFNYTGPGQADHFLVPKIVKHIRKRASCIELGNIDVSRDFSDVRDVVSIYAALLDTTLGDSGSIVNIGSGHAVSLRTLVHTLETLAGHSVTIKVNPEFVRQNEIPELKADISVLNERLARHRRIPLSKTLQDMLNMSSSNPVDFAS